MEQNQATNKKIHYVNSYNECKANGRIYLMIYVNKNKEMNENQFTFYERRYNVFYFIDKDALSEEQINEIRKEFVSKNNSFAIKRDYNDDIKYQKQFENKIRELGVDLYVFSKRNVQQNIQYL